MGLNINEVQKIALEMMQATIEVCEKNNITYYALFGTVLGAVRHNGIIPWDHDVDLGIPENEIDFFVSCAKRDLPDKYYVDYHKDNSKSFCIFPRIALKGHTSDVLHVDIFRMIGIPDHREEQVQMMLEARSYTAGNNFMKLSFARLLCHGNRRYIFKRAKYIFRSRRWYLNKFDEVCSRYSYETSNYVLIPSGIYKEKNIFLKEVYGCASKCLFENFYINIPQQYEFYLKQYYNDYMQLPPHEERERELNKVFEI